MLRRSFERAGGGSFTLEEAVRRVLETKTTFRWVVYDPAVPPAAGSETGSASNAESSSETDARRRSSFTRYTLEAQPMQADDAHAVLLSLNEDPRDTSDADGNELAFGAHLLGQPGLYVHRFRPDTTETFVGNTYARLLGDTPEAIRGTRWIMRVPPEEREAYCNILERLTPERPTAMLEHPLTDSNGNRRLIQWNVRAFFAPDGSIDVCQAVGFDNTHEQQVEKALFARTEWLQRILENVQPILFVLDRDGTILLSEGEDLHALGVTRGELVGESVYALYQDVPGILDHVDAALGGDRVEAVVEYKGLTFNTWFAPFREASGEVAGVIGMGVNMTGQVEAESALEKSEATYRNIIDQASDALYIQVPTGHFIDVNEAGAASYGYRRQEMIGMTPADVAAPRRNDMSALRQHLRDALDGTPQQFEFWGKRRDGRVFPQEMRVQAATYFGLDVAVVVARDITERKAREQDLIRARDAAEAANRLKSTILSNMSHEIRTPLTGIMGFAEMIADERFSEDASVFAERIHRSSQRLLRTLDDLLLFADLEAGRPVHALRTCDLAKVVGQSVHAFKETLEDTANRVRCHLPNAVNGQWHVRAVRRMLRPVLRNAVVFSGPNDPIHVRLRATETGARLSVQDEGIGMSASFVAEACKPFTQESHGYTREYEGNGLGLAIVDRLVDQVGGTLTVESVKREGTTVSIHIPNRACPSSTDAPDAPSAESAPDATSGPECPVRSS